MDSSPLVKGHDHARAASCATQSSDTSVAISEHVLAAGEFATAAKQTSNLEAIRTLKLLEEHHKRLSDLLKIPSEHPLHNLVSDATQSKQSSPVAPKAESQPDVSSSKPTPPVPSPSVQTRRPPSTRDLTSSIASNLASARGIRSNRGQALAPTVSNGLASGSLDSNTRKDGSQSRAKGTLDQPGKPGRSPTDPRPAETDAQSKPAPTEEGYSRFYSTFGNLINALTAPLAFAGLPLNPDQAEAEQAPAPKPPTQKRPTQKPKAPQTGSADPDLKKLYSKSALRALSRDVSSDSFYVVPTSGHTVSYASIVNFAEKERRRLEASRAHVDMEDIPEDPDEDDFVDAREIQAPLSPAARQRIGKSHDNSNLHNTIEELYTENQGLKDMLDKLSKRLHAFEASAQSSSMALAESMRLMRPNSPSAASGSGKDSDSELTRRRELEKQLVDALKRVDELEKVNLKQDKALMKYREKWEALKAGAKARREAQASMEGLFESKPAT